MSLEQNQRSVTKFNRWAKTYDRGRLNPWFSRGQARVLEALRLKAGDWLLDVGCGTGWAIIQAAQQIPNGRACGIDLSPQMIKGARDLAGGLSNVEFQVADAEAIPYPAETFDAVICTHSFHHYSDPTAALAEIHRVLKPGGQLVLLDSNRGACLWVWLCNQVLLAIEKGHVQYYTEEELFRLLLNAGFTLPTLIALNHGHFGHGKVGWAVCLISARKPSRH